MKVLEFNKTQTDEEKEIQKAKILADFAAQMDEPGVLMGWKGGQPVVMIISDNPGRMAFMKFIFNHCIDQFLEAFFNYKIQHQEYPKGERPPTEDN